MTRRVVITGLGVVSALGNNLADHWAALVEGRSGIRPLESVDSTRLAFTNGGEVRDFDPKVLFADRTDRELDRFTQFALVAAAQAVEDAKLELNEAQKDRVAVITGSSGGGLLATEAAYNKLYVLENHRVHPHTIPRVMANAGASSISMKYGFRGPAFTTSTACSSSNHAIGLAYWLVRDGVADYAVTGGSETAMTFGMLKAWDAIRVVSPETCRPFSLNRPGMIIGEGGGMIVIETLESALARGAQIYAELCGFGMSADAHHLTQPSLAGPTRAMQAALRDGDFDIESIDYINAHGTGTPANDANECKSIREVFGAHADKLAVSSTKSMHGHALGAAGALEAVATAKAIAEETLPPTANFTEVDPDCDLDVVPNESRHCKVDAALSNSFAFGGLNAVLAFRRYDSP